MKREDTWRAARRNAVTLVKGRGPRVVLVAMHLGSTIAFNGTEGPVVLQVIEGRVRLNARPRASMLEAGCVALLQEEGAHGLRGLGGLFPLVGNDRQDTELAQEVGGAVELR